MLRSTCVVWAPMSRPPTIVCRPSSVSAACVGGSLAGAVNDPVAPEVQHHAFSMGQPRQSRTGQRRKSPTVERVDHLPPGYDLRSPHVRCRPVGPRHRSAVSRSEEKVSGCSRYGA